MAVLLRLFGRAMIVAVVLFLIALCILVAVPKANAQTGDYVWSERSSSSVHGRYVVMWNATGTEIPEGTLVQVDTTGATTQPQIPMGKGFKTWTADTLDVYKIVGVTIGNTPGYRWARIMVDGFLNNVKLDASGVTGFTRLRPSLTHPGRLTAYAVGDSISQYHKPCAIFQRYARSDTLASYVYIRMNWLGR